ncbi:MAG: hypothetical protein ACLUAR_00670 [Pilosibacter sp.]
MRWSPGVFRLRGTTPVTVALAHLEEPMPDPRMLNRILSLARDHLKMYGKETGAPIPERRRHGGVR